MERPPQYRYKIQEDPSRYFTGWAHHGNDRLQILIGALSDRQCTPGVVAVFFDLGGALVRVEHRGLPKPVTEEDWRLLDQRKRQLLATWQSELGFEPATIEVGKFTVDDHDIEIRDYP